MQVIEPLDRAHEGGVPEPARPVGGVAPATWVAAAGLLVALAGFVLAQRASGAISGLTALWLVHAVGLPLVLAALRPRLPRLLIAATLVVAVAWPGYLVVQRIVDPPASQLAGHDGGVWVTRAAAEDVLHGRNPYAQTFDDDLPAEWLRISTGGEPFANPITTIYPYLPGAFLAVAPLAALPGGTDLGDPRVLMLATFALAMLLVARDRSPGWARVATLAASTGPLVAIHLAYGTNDTWSAALVVVAALLATRWPRTAALALGLAISVKFLVVLAVLPFGLWLWDRGGWAALRRWWPTPAFLLATCLPFLVAGPRAFLDDTLLFWAGANDRPFPTSGFGLPAVAPDVFQGPLLGLTTLLLALAGLAGAVLLVRRLPGHPGILPVATAVAMVGVLVPARTFQGNYLVAVAGLLATGWLVVGDRRGGAEPEGADRPDDAAADREVPAAT
ncbi:hypothetical protein PO878_10120 [Iamia majanohamensis]|uniref:DUF2029 domain-containing protein n=1 Tax=Iamia majanohamensis TaxID=467976 RepID=A0AAF0BSY1_9ACTN|nr:hypothetical protein [Iamia majanohamensis]WCO69081.1 hypothetical protein PO878_10120 [Iamia majanohamensis]